MAIFQFQQFAVDDSRCGMKIGTDGVLLGAWVQAPEAAVRMLDVGSGCGLVALMLAQRFPQAHITGLEIDAVASQQAQENFSASRWAQRLTVVCNDYLQWPGTARYSLIVSNPPFFVGGAANPQAERHTARHDDTLPLPALLAKSRQLLDADGELALIFPSERDSELMFASQLARLYPRRRCRVSSRQGKPPVRTLWQLATSRGPLNEETLAIRAFNGELTAEYLRLVGEFYTKLH